MSRKKLFLLDAMALIYRAHFAFIKNPRVNSKGENTSAVFGFLNSLLEILQKEDPTHIGVAFDLDGGTFRHEEFPEYKAHREEVPEDIIWSIPRIKELLRLLEIPVLEKQGYEADDLIGTIAGKAAAEGFEVYMVTPDKDFAQLVNEQVYLYKPSYQGNGHEVYDPVKVEQKFGIPPHHIVDFLGLKGDKVDNIPGIPKVGDKTAVELITQFGTVEDIVANVEQITKKSIKATVTEFGHQGILSKKLATIHTDVPVEWSLETLHITKPDPKPVLGFMKELEFKAMASRLLQCKLFADAKVQQDLFGNVIRQANGDSNGTKVLELESELLTLEGRKHNYQLIKSPESRQELIDKIREKGYFCFDTETTSLNPMQAKLIAITFSFRKGDAWMEYFKENDQSMDDTLETLKAVFEDDSILKIGQNLKYDILVLRNHGVQVKGELYDTLLAHFVIDPDKPHSMDRIAVEYLKYEPIAITSLIGKKGKNQLSMRAVPVEKLLDYACEDADITYELKGTLEKELAKRECSGVLTGVELPLLPVLAEMEYTGVKVDKETLSAYSLELEKEIAVLQDKIFDLAGMEFNINSPKQLGDILFDRLKLGKGKKTRTGQYKTDEATLSQLALIHDMPATVLKFRQFSKLKSTYVDALPALIHPRTGRIHTTYSQTVAVTGRLSSNNPNLQNIPIRTDEGREIRKAFVPGEDEFLLLSADYSQVELRLMAHLSKDESMIEAFRTGADIHRATAARVFGVDADAVTSEMRSRAKMVNFGIIYGISAFGLSQRLGIPRSEAKDIIDSYFEKFPAVKAYMDQSIDEARIHGYAKTILGRRRYLADINSNNATVRGFAERNAINTPVQGSAADLIKLAMIRIFRIFNEEKLRSKMIMQVHDELVFEVHQDELERVKEIVAYEMQHAMEFDVPMSVDMGTGLNWLEAH